MTASRDITAGRPRSWACSLAASVVPTSTAAIGGPYPAGVHRGIDDLARLCSPITTDDRRGGELARCYATSARPLVSQRRDDHDLVLEEDVRAVHVLAERERGHADVGLAGSDHLLDGSGVGDNHLHRCIDLPLNA